MRQKAKLPAHKINEEKKTTPIYDLWQFEEKKERNDMHYRVINDSIGYIDLKLLDLDEIPDMMDSIMPLPRMIIDIRNYPKGVLYELSKYIHPEPTTFAEVFVPDIVIPGSFFWNNTIETGRQNPDYYKGKIILLVNEQTQSHAEFTALCLQSAPNVITIGSTTAGTDGNMSVIPIPGGIETYFSGIGITYPDRSQAQRTGVKIDTIVHPEIEDIRLGNDAVLEVAKRL